MAAPLVTKVVLKSTTKMSLNERFTAYRAQTQNLADSTRQKIQLQRQTSSANLRLAQQMANRPSVMAALRLKKRSLQQRLGRRQQPAISNIKDRINMNGRRFNTSIRGRLGFIRGRGRGSARGGAFKPGTSPLLRGRLGNTRPFNSMNNFNNKRMDFRKRGGFRGRNYQARGNYRSQPRGAQRGGRGRGGRGRGGFGRWNQKSGLSVPTKQELDNQLDQYMAETKGIFDANLM